VRKRKGKVAAVVDYLGCWDPGLLFKMGALQFTELTEGKKVAVGNFSRRGGILKLKKRGVKEG